MNVLYQLYVITTTKQQNKKIYSFTLRRVKKANLNSLYLVQLLHIIQQNYTTRLSSSTSEVKSGQAVVCYKRTTYIHN